MPSILLTNERIHSVTLSTLGAAITSIRVPAEVTVTAGSSAGKSIGRYANRIARGCFTLDGVQYRLPANENGNTLHGGPDGFSHREWSVAHQDERSVAFALHSEDGDQGFPGNLDTSAEYLWTAQDELQITYTAQTDKPTVVNFTNHVYFNLGGEDTVANYTLQITASRFIEVDEQLIPTGRILPVAGTDRDFRTARPLGDAPIDCCYALDEWDGSLRVAGRLTDSRNCLAIEVVTTEPGFQLYTGKKGAVAMEMQHFPDAPNHPGFPSTILRPGDVHRSQTIYRFLQTART